MLRMFLVHTQNANAPVKQNARRQQRPHDGLDRLMVELIPLADLRHRHRLQKQLKDLRYVVATEEIFVWHKAGSA